MGTQWEPVGAGVPAKAWEVKKEVRVVGEGVVGEFKKAEPDTAQRRSSEAGKPLAWE